MQEVEVLNEVEKQVLKVPKWYFGGCASALAACITHPLDLLKVHLQTAKKSKEFDLYHRTRRIIHVQGVAALYNGLTASLFRQLTYSTTRFGMYEIMKQSLNEDPKNITLQTKIGMAAISGALGGFLGTPAEIINVRMQNDIKLPYDFRRNYHHVIDGMTTVIRYEGVRALFNGTSLATSRAVLMTIGQLSMYDQYKYSLLNDSVFRGFFVDNFVTHILASLSAGATATTLTLPLDVIKTRYMNETIGRYKGFVDVAKSIYQDYGLVGFYRGIVPAFVRLAPQTVLTFVFLENLNKKFGTPLLSRPLPSLADIAEAD